jgi:hypothetical protein
LGVVVKRPKIGKKVEGGLTVGFLPLDEGGARFFAHEIGVFVFVR